MSGTKDKMPKQTLVTFDIDIDVLDWYKSQREDYQSLMNEVLRADLEKNTNIQN